MISLDVPARTASLEVEDRVLEQRRARWTAPPSPKRGYAKLYVDQVLQAHEGADLDFLVGNSGSAVPRESH
jgi:L-arabonate dehydrase